MNNSFRKAAILISTLDTRAADALLDQMGETQATRVRQAIMNLGDIPPAEQQQVIAEFLRGGGSPTSLKPLADDEGGVELDISLAERLENEAEFAAGPLENAPQETAPPSPALPPFHCLQAADSAILADVLKSEQAQTIAVVIAHLPPERAAAVLERLPAELSTEALARMAWLSDLNAEVLRDVEQQLQAALLPRLSAPRARPQSLANVTAVLSALSGSRRNETLRTLAAHDERLIRQLGYLAPEVERIAPPHEPLRHEPLAHRAPARHALPAPRANEFEFTFADLGALRDDDLKRVFGSADAEVAMLALTGADERLMRRIVRQMPAHEAQTLRRKLNHPGPVRLRDLEAAQEKIAQIASRLAESGQIELPGRRRFAAAA
jgi:flagellar motor switch protein FliG